MFRSLTRFASSLLLCAGVLHPVWAQSTLLDEVQTVAAATVAVPVEHTFIITAAGDYNLTLTDLGAQYGSALASVELAVTGNDVVVGSPLTAAGTLSLKSLQPGTYQYHVTGKPGTGPGSGPFGVQVVSTAGGTPVASDSDTLALPPNQQSNGQATLNATFTMSAAGSYQLSMADLQLPASLSTLLLALVPEGATSPLATLPDPTTGAYQTTVQLATGVNYRLVAVAQVGSSATAGIFSATVTPAGGGTPVYQATQPVGALTALGNTPTLNSGSYSVTLADLATPAALTQVAGVLVQNGSAVLTLTAAGSQTLNSSGGVYELFGLATPAATPGTGSYALTVQPQGGGNPVASFARAVATSGNGISVYSYNANVTAGGAYDLNLADFTFPKQFSSLSAFVVQNGVILGAPLHAAGSAPVSPAAGPVSILVFAGAGSSGGLFGIDLTPSLRRHLRLRDDPGCRAAVFLTNFRRDHQRYVHSVGERPRLPRALHQPGRDRDPGLPTGRPDLRQRHLPVHGGPGNLLRDIRGAAQHHRRGGHFYVERVPSAHCHSAEQCYVGDRRRHRDSEVE